jgi:hypothetical protein
MPEHIRIVDTGAINIDDRPWQFAAPEQIPFWRDLAEETEVIRLLGEQGAVRVEIDANYDEDYHEAEEYFMWGITYGEYWESHPDQKIEKPVPCWQTWILLSVNAPFMRLLSPTADRTLIAEWDVVRWHEDWPQGDYRFYLALTSATQPDLELDLETDDLRPEAQPPIVIQPSQISLLPSDPITNVPGHGWQLGEDMTLQPLLDYEPAPSQHDWDWAWRSHPSYGPINLKIFVDKTAAELKVWFERLFTTELPNHDFYPYLCRDRVASLVENRSEAAAELRTYFRELAIAELPTSNFYQCVGDLQTQRQSRLSLHQVYLPDGDHSYVVKQWDHPQGWLSFHDGLVRLTPNYQTPNLGQQSIDAILLMAILAGDLGELSWDLLDGDYVYFEATGNGLASLQAYLAPNAEIEQLRQEWERLLTWHNVDASAANNAQEAAVLIAQHFQVPLTGSDAIAHLETWLCATPIAQRPRYVTVKLPGRLGNVYREDPDYPRIVSANSRILWRWSFDG